MKKSEGIIDKYSMKSVPGVGSLVERTFKGFKNSPSLPPVGGDPLHVEADARPNIGQSLGLSVLPNHQQTPPASNTLNIKKVPSHFLL